MNNKENALNFIQQLIDITETKDNKEKKDFESGDSWLVFNLKLLKNLIDKI